MQARNATSPNEVKKMTTEELRSNFLIEKPIVGGEINFVYSHYDRVIVGGAMPTDNALLLGNYDYLKADYFLQRREMGIINVGGSGIVG